MYSENFPIMYTWEVEKLSPSIKLKIAANHAFKERENRQENVHENLTKECKNLQRIHAQKQYGQRSLPVFRIRFCVCANEVGKRGSEATLEKGGVLYYMWSVECMSNE